VLHTKRTIILQHCYRLDNKCIEFESLQIRSFAVHADLSDSLEQACYYERSEFLHGSVAAAETHRWQRPAGKSLIHRRLEGAMVERWQISTCVKPTRAKNSDLRTERKDRIANDGCCLSVSPTVRLFM
jgi:hypothetical protein